MRSWLSVLVAALLAGGTGCALESSGTGKPTTGSDGGTADVTSDFEPPPVGVWPCGPTEKRCDGVCVGMQTDPALYGCDKVDCSPCPSVANTDVTCLNFDCATGGCLDGADDCDANEPGCETDLRTLDNCGECGKICAVGSGEADCSTGVCKIANCESGWGDCDGDPLTGCETNLHTLTDCGDCGTPCAVADPDIPSCSKGYCDKICDPTNPLREDCDGNPSNGCETALDTLENCGGCGNQCSRANASALCDGGNCAIDECNPGWSNCDGIDGNGCESNTQTNVNHCGGCDSACSDDHVSNRTCTGGQCVPNCAAEFGDCNGPKPRDSDDGCETPLDTVTNCGGCGAPCQLPHAVEACPGGFCQIASCTQPWGDCDQNHSNGCEANTTSDTNNCGSCGYQCTATGGTPACSQSVCVTACSPGLGDCDGNPNNGCETDTSSNLDHCGACGVSCIGAHVVNPACANGVCTSGCEADWADCDGDLSTNGCEINVATDSDHCGGCDQSCSTNYVIPSCTGGNCDGGCLPGYTDCNRDLRADGCEANTDTDPDHCGGCDMACSGNNIARACSGGDCSGTCNAGWADCDGDSRWNGCERNVATDKDNCGGCNWVCDSDGVFSRSCVNGLCDPNCFWPTDDCNGPQPGNVDDGCEGWEWEC